MDVSQLIEVHKALTVRGSLLGVTIRNVSMYKMMAPVPIR